MARSRFQTGSLIAEGRYWKCRYYEDVIDDDGNLKRKRPKVTIGPRSGPGKLTEPQAKARMAEIMADVNENAWRPASLLTVKEFYEKRFWPEHVVHCEHAGKLHYKHYLGTHVLPTLGELPLRDITATHVRLLIAAKAPEYSPQTLKHVKAAVRRLFNHAKEAGFYAGDNPAAHVKIPRAGRPTKKVQGYTLEEATRILHHLKSPLWEMAVLAMTTSMNVAEMSGLCVGRVNLQSDPRLTDGDVIPGFSIAVRENLYHGRRGDVKTGHRRRELPIPAELIEPLRTLCAGRSAEDPVFVMPRTATTQGGVLKAVNSHNVTNRHFKALSTLLGFKVNWHRFRHTQATMTDRMGFDPEDRRKMLGHGSSEMTARYTHPFERRRAAADAIAAQLLGLQAPDEDEETIQ